MAVIAAEIDAESLEDIVGLWELARSLSELRPALCFLERVELVILIARTVLSRGELEFGRLRSDCFDVLSVDLESFLLWLRDELLELGRDPNIAEIGCFVRKCDSIFDSASGEPVEIPKRYSALGKKAIDVPVR